MKVLVTGGAGYIGSTTASALEMAGHTPIVFDSLLSGPRQFTEGRAFYEGDIADRSLTRRIFYEHPDIEVTLHMAARIVVPESVERPIEYYRDNVSKSLEFFDQVSKLGHPRIVFSSSASVYAPAPTFEVKESSATEPPSPYAWTKLMMEVVLKDFSVSGAVSAVALRYFNPIGADPDLRSGVYARNPSHVVGQLLRAARGQQRQFTLTGTDLPTRDGTGLRDYIHVWDLAQAHVQAVERFDGIIEAEGSPFSTINLGTGDGVTVRELIASFERVTGLTVPIEEAPARPGDAIGAYANVEKAARLLDWRARHSIDDGIASALAWSEKRKQILGYD